MQRLPHADGVDDDRDAEFPLLTSFIQVLHPVAQVAGQDTTHLSPQHARERRPPHMAQRRHQIAQEARHIAAGARCLL